MPINHSLSTKMVKRTSCVCVFDIVYIPRTASHLDLNTHIHFHPSHRHTLTEVYKLTTVESWKVDLNTLEAILTAFFKLCQSDLFARTLLYFEVLMYYTWPHSRWNRINQGIRVKGWEESAAFRREVNGECTMCTLISWSASFYVYYCTMSNLWRHNKELCTT